MRILTLTQPWATMVALGVKRIETRAWSTRYRGALGLFAPPVGFQIERRGASAS
jgi:hypothetical protein